MDIGGETNDRVTQTTICYLYLYYVTLFTGRSLVTSNLAYHCCRAKKYCLHSFICWDRTAWLIRSEPQPHKGLLAELQGPLLAIVRVIALVWAAYGSVRCELFLCSRSLSYDLHLPSRWQLTINLEYSIISSYLWISSTTYNMDLASQENSQRANRCKLSTRRVWSYNA